MVSMEAEPVKNAQGHENYQLESNVAERFKLASSVPIKESDSQYGKRSPEAAPECGVCPLSRMFHQFHRLPVHSLAHSYQCAALKIPMDDYYGNQDLTVQAILVADS